MSAEARLNHIDQTDFYTAYDFARNESMATNTVRNGFAATGLVPFDPEQAFGSSILSHGRQLHLQTPLFNKALGYGK